MKKQQIDPNWIAWAKHKVELLKDGGHLIFPSEGAIFQVNKKAKTITLVCSVPTWINSATESTNEKVFAKINYRYIRPDNVPVSIDSIISEIFDNLHKYSSDLDTMFHGIGIIFGLKEEDDLNNEVLLDLIARKGKKVPINPVTIRGEGNFTVGRIWIGINKTTIPDTAHRFNPTVKRSQAWEKPITIVLWKENETLDIHDPNRPVMIVDESDFIEFVKSTKKLPATIKLWGQANRVEEHQKMVASFSIKNKLIEVNLYNVVSDDDQVLVGKAVLNFENFLECLSHLFPNGELE